MTETYYLTNTDSDLSVPGDNFDKELSRSPGAANTIDITLAQQATETDYGYTPPNDPSTDGGSGSRTWTVNWDINGGNSDFQISCQIHRINSSGSVQNSSATSSEQQATAGIKVFTFSTTDLGSFGDGDRLRVDFIVRDTSAHGNNTISYNIESGGTNIVVPWTISVAAVRRIFIT